jgi:hypothetical protein
VKAGWGGLLALAVLVTAAACWAPAARAGTYDVLSCSIDGGFYANNAWVAGNNPGGNAAHRFNSPAGRFTFRLRLRPNDSYPYARGTSKAVRIRVG